MTRTYNVCTLTAVDAQGKSHALSIVNDEPDGAVVSSNMTAQMIENFGRRFLDIAEQVRKQGGTHAKK